MTIETAGSNAAPTGRDRPRLLLRQDVAFLQTPDGMYVRRAGEGFLIRGSSAFGFIQALAPHLDGSVTDAALVDGLPDAHARSVLSLLGCLRDRGAIVDLAPDGPGLPAEFSERFSAQRQLLRHFGDGGEGMAAVGAAVVRVLAADPDHREAMVSCLAINGVGAAGGRLSAGDLTQERVEPGTTLVIALAPDRADGRLLPLAHRAADAGAGFLSLLRVGDELMLGPHQPAGAAPWTASALLRLVDSSPVESVDLVATGVFGPSSAGDRPVLSPGAAELGISMLGFEAFKILSGAIDTGLDAGVVWLDAETLETRLEPLVAHPLVAVSDPAPSDPVRPAAAPAGEPVDRAEADYSRFAPLVAPRVGPFARFADDDLPQIPVRVAVLEAPALRAEPFVEVGTDSVLHCRLRALEAAAAEYAVALHRRAGGRLPWAVTASTETLLAGPQQRRRAGAAPDLRGLAAGPDVATARERALTHLLGAQALDAVLDGSVPLGRVPDAAAAGVAELDALWAAAAAEGLALEIYAADAVLPVAVVIGGGELRAAASALTWARAAQDALLRVLGAHQARHTSVAGALTCRARGRDLRVVSDGADLVGLETSTEEALRRLAAAGTTTTLVELTTPDLQGVTHVVRADAVPATTDTEEGGRHE